MGPAGGLAPAEPLPIEAPPPTSGLALPEGLVTFVAPDRRLYLSPLLLEQLLQHRVARGLGVGVSEARQPVDDALPYARLL